MPTLEPGQSRAVAAQASGLHMPVPSTADAAQLAEPSRGTALDAFLLQGLHLPSTVQHVRRYWRSEAAPACR